MRKIFFIIAAVFVFSHSSYAWDTTAAKFYPLKVGNTYTFDKMQYLVSCIGNFVARFKVTVTAENVLLNGKRYYQLSSSSSAYALYNSYWKYQRIDSATMNVYGYSVIENKEYLLDSLMALTGNSFKCARFDVNNSTGTYVNTQTINFFGSSKIQKMFFSSPAPTQYFLVEGIGFTGYYSCLDFGDGLILRGCVVNGIKYGDTISTNVSLISLQIPEKFSLKQNYPNPFNPSTKIGYELVKEGYTELNIFDAEGKCISTLVSENQKAGSYEAIFYSYGLSSGIYYYKLSTGTYTEVKKMCILK